MSIDLSHIQDLADASAKEDCPTPDFPIPADCDTTGETSMEIRDTENKGKGFYATQDIEAGSTLLGAKPLAMVMGWEEEEEEDEMEDDESMEMDDGIMRGSKRNGMLILRTAKAMKETPSLWFDQINNLFPRKENSTDLPIWMCDDAVTGMEVEDAVNGLAEIKEFSDEPNLVEEIRQRLPFIIRYNCLSVETAPELFVHPNQPGGGHLTLSGTGLYYYPSYFNHSHKPNVTRYAIGDVQFFVTNQDVKSGDELCISYIESEHLCENPELRSNLLDMDFKETSEEDDDDQKKNAGKPQKATAYPVVDVDMQDELMSMHPLERLDEIKGLLQEATSDDTSATMDGEGEELHWFKCDVQQLRILLALTYDSLGQSSKALEEWEHCLSFAKEKLPPGKQATIAHLLMCLSSNTVSRTHLF